MRERLHSISIDFSLTLRNSFFSSTPSPTLSSPSSLSPISLSSFSNFSFLLSVSLSLSCIDQHTTTDVQYQTTGVVALKGGEKEVEEVRSWTDAKILYREREHRQRSVYVTTSFSHAFLLQKMN